MHRAAGCLWVALAVAATTVRAAGAPPQRRALTPEDYYRIQSVSEPQCSPDGEWIAYVVERNDRESDEARSTLWLVSWDGSQRVELTHGASAVKAPRWSGDGRLLAYLAAPSGTETSQLMLLDRRGGEPRQATRVSGEIVAYAWAPQGQRLVLALRSAGESVTQSGVGLGTAPKVPKPIVVDALHFKADEDGYIAAGDSQHLYLFDVSTGKLEELTHEPGVTDSAPAFSPDGRQIAFVRSRERGMDPDGMTDLEVIDADGAAAARLLARIHAPNTQRLAWSADGLQIAYLQGLEPRYNAYMQDHLAVVPAAGGAPRSIPDTLDRAVAAQEFTADGSAVTAIIEDDGLRYPARISLATGTVKRLVAQPMTVSALCAAGGHVAALASSDEAAAEIYRLEDGRLTKLTTHNDALLAVLALGTVEDIRFKSRDGTEIHGLLVEPPGYVAGRRYPAIVWIHGGPNGQDEHALPFDTYPLQLERQLLAAQGYVVLAINYRGSSGRGLDFARAIIADWGHKEVEDLLAGVDFAIARGIADPQRLGIGGWSYGGILTDYTIARDARFRAAVSGAGSANQLAMYGSDQYIVQYNAELGPPWRNAALWMKVSYPFFHADRIRTPTLFLGGQRDFNVPITGGEQMYQALRTLGVPSQLVVYPDQYHIFTRPSYIHDRAERVLAWYRRYLNSGSAGH
jgi:dipeptidyl aminopeptidase/acylaminoacyl peptidase